MTEKKNQDWELLGEKSGALHRLPKVFILFKAIKKIHCLMRLSRGEIMGRGWVTRKDNDFIITDVFILKQKADATNAIEEPVDLNQLAGQRGDSSELTFQWHSCAYEQLEFSYIDLDLISGQADGYLISLVINKEGKYLCRLDLFKPFYVGFKVPLLVILPTEEELISFCRQEIEKNVREINISLTSLLPKSFRESLKLKDPRFNDWDKEKQPVVISLEDLVFAEEKEG